MCVQVSYLHPHAAKILGSFELQEVHDRVDDAKEGYGDFGIQICLLRYVVRVPKHRVTPEYGRREVANSETQRKQIDRIDFLEQKYISFQCIVQLLHAGEDFEPPKDHENDREPEPEVERCEDPEGEEPWFIGVVSDEARGDLVTAKHTHTHTHTHTHELRHEILSKGK